MLRRTASASPAALVPGTLDLLILEALSHGERHGFGADRARIARMVLKDGLRPVVEGLVIGLGSALVLRQFLRATFVPELSAVDPIAFSLAGGLLIGAGILACLAPARRASRVQPTVALRISSRAVLRSPPHPQAPSPKPKPQAQAPGPKPQAPGPKRPVAKHRAGIDNE